MSEGARSGLGIISMAFGPERYMRQAENLSLSLRRHMPGMGLAIITDARSVEGFDHIVPINAVRWGLGVSQKVFLDEYSPFEETLYLDADCLATRPFHAELEALRRFSFTSAGSSYLPPSARYSGVRNLAATLGALGLSRFPVFNGGLYFFRRDSASEEVFHLAGDILRRWQELGLKRFDQAGPNEETVFALAVEKLGLPLKSGGGRLMKTPIGIIGRLQVDPLGGGTRFNKAGKIVEPAICHFSGNRWTWPEYRICERLLRGQPAGALVRLGFRIEHIAAGAVIRARSVADGLLKRTKAASEAGER
jgi:hypothetical protein